MGRAGRAFLAALVASLAGLAEAMPWPEEHAGPPSYSINGCPSHAEWTPAVVAGAFGVPERVVRRANNRFAAPSLLLCTLPHEQAMVILGRAAAPKPGFDQPDRAMQHRLGAMKGDDGRVDPLGAARADRQRMALVANVAKQGGLSTGQPFWTSIGPGTVGGRVRAILPMTPTRVLIGSVSGGLWITENAGGAWAPVQDLMPNVAITCLVADPADASIIYVCTGEGAYPSDAIQGDGVYRITNATQPSIQWTIARVPGTTPLDANSPWFWVNRLVVIPNPADPANTANRVLVAATRAGLYRSADGGATFARVAGNNDAGFPYPHRYMDVKSHPLDPSNIVAGEMFTFGAGGGVAVSTDSGATWSRVTVAGSERIEVAPVSGVAGRWLALSGNNGGQLFRSDDGGAHWARQDTAGLDSATPSTGGIMGTQAWYNQAVWASPDGTRVIAGGVHIRFSVDGGATFATITSGIHSDHHAIVPATDNATSGTVYFGNDGGVYKASGVNALASAAPGPVFTSLNNGLAITQFYGAAGLGGFITGGTQDNGSKSWRNGTWTGTFGGDGGRSAVDPADPAYVYGEAQNGALWRSTNGGVSASYICAGITEAGGCPGAATFGTLFIAPFTLDLNAPDRMFFGGTMLWRSTNVKAATPTWSAVKAQQPSQLGAYNATISAIAMRPASSDVVWVGYTDGQVWRTTDATAATPTWERIVFNGVANPTRQVLRILLDPDDPARAWVGLSGYNTGNVLRTDNATAAGASVAWTDVHGNLPAAPVHALARHPQVASVLYAGTEVGVFASDTAGTTWSTQNEGPGTVSVEELFFLDASTLVAATHGRGVFTASFTLPTAPGTVQFTQASLPAMEGTSASFTVTRTGGSFGAATASYAAQGGSATSGVDYAATSGTLAWADGDTSSRTITIPIAADALTEGIETFTLAITGVTGASAAWPSSVAVSIYDPEAFPPNAVMPAGWVRPTTFATNAALTDNNIVQGWIVDADPANAYEGLASLRSGDMAGQANRRAALEAVVATGAGNVTFATKVVSGDCLRFYVDQVVAGSWCSMPFVGIVNGLFAPVYGTVSIPVTAGTHTFRWSYEKTGSADVSSNAVWIDAVSFPPAGLEAAITSPATADFTVGAAGTFTVTATGSPAPSLALAGTLPPGLAFTAGTGVIAGTPGAGSGGNRVVTITASNGRYPDASQVLTLAVARAAQSIAFGALADRALGSGTFTVTASATSTLAVAISSLTPSTCTIAGGTVTLVAQGACTLQATQGGNGDYTAAAPISQGFTVLPPASVAPTITSAAATTFTVGAAGTFTVTTTGTPAPARSVTGTLPAGVSFQPSTAVFSGTPASGTVGTYPLVVHAANGTPPDAAQNFTLTIAKAPQAVAFGAAPAVTVGRTQFVSAWSDSGLPVDLASSTPAVCTVAYGVLTAVAAGTCTLTADQPGDGDYLPAAQQALSFPIAAGPAFAPRSASARPGTGSAEISFSAPVGDGGSPVVSYSASCTPGAHVATASASPLTVAGLADGTTYSCTVRAVNGTGPGDASVPLLVTPGGGAGPFAYIANGGTENVSVIARATRQVVATLAVGRAPLGVAVTPDGARALVTNTADDTISVIDTAQHLVTRTLSTGLRPYGIAVNPAGTLVFVALQGEDKLAAIDLATYASTTFASGPTPAAIAFSPDGARAWATHWGDDTLGVYDVAARALTRSVAVDASPFAVAVHPSGSPVYTASQWSDTICTVDATTFALGRVAVGVEPVGLAIDPAGTRLLVANSSGNSATVLSAPAHAVLATLPMPGYPTGAAIDGTGAFGYVVNTGTSQVSVIDMATLTVAATVDLGNAMASPFSLGAFLQPAAVVPPPPVTHVTVAPAALDFGGQSMATTSPVLAVTVTNGTNAATTIGAVNTGSAQFIATSHCPASLAAGATCMIDVAFAPAVAPGALLSTTAAGATLSIATGDGSKAVALAGLGEKSLVTHFYRAILGRAPDAGGKAYWEAEAARMAGLGADVNETWFVMAGWFFASPEYAARGKSDAAFLTDLYVTFFNRAPDAGGLAYWGAQLAGGLPREVVLYSFLFSPEFTGFTQAIFGASAARAEVNVVMDFFRGVLNRLPDSPSFAYWLGRMRTAQCAGALPVRQEVADASYNFIFSAEYNARARTPTQFVTDMYYSFLRRGGDAAGVQFWVGELQAGRLSLVQVRDAFIASPEFAARVNAVVAQGCVGSG